MKPTEKQHVRVRFAPSPTGSFHIGGARTALFNWLFARQHDGVFILRIEDTDKERSAEIHEKEIFESLSWLGIEWDEGPDTDGTYGPYRQSERGEIYKKYLEQLLKEEKAYYCYCTKEELEAQKQSMLAQGLAPKYNGHCRQLTEPPREKTPQVIRFKTPELQLSFKDIIRGTVTFDTALFGDFAIAKSLSSPLYNFAVVVDDAEMKISHVIRGEDHLSNTPKQILLFKALGINEPVYAHLPLILAADRSKLSKRYAETSLLSYREEGYLPEALLNFIVLLGWHPKDEKEVFSQNELIEIFDLKRVQKAGAVFNVEKLEWLNREHLKQLSPKHIHERLMPRLKAKGIDASEAMVLKIVEAERERMKTLNDFFELADFFFALPEYEPQLLVWNNDSPNLTKSILESEIKSIDGLKTITQNSLKEALSPLIEKHGNGSVLWPLRSALSGKRASPDPYVIAEILGKKEVLLRLKKAIDKFGSLL